MKAEPDDLRAMIDEIMVPTRDGRSTVGEMLRDAFANFPLQKFLQAAKEPQRAKLFDETAAQLVHMRRYSLSFGKVRPSSLRLDGWLAHVGGAVPRRDREVDHQRTRPDRLPGRPFSTATRPRLHVESTQLVRPRSPSKSPRSSSPRLASARPQANRKSPLRLSFSYTARPLPAPRIAARPYRRRRPLLDRFPREKRVGRGMYLSSSPQDLASPLSTALVGVGIQWW